MEDPTLNRSLEETRELQARWSQFREFYNMASKAQQRITAQAEMKFLELKSRIAMLHDGFMEKLQHDQKVGMNIMTIVGDCILLSRVAVATDAEKQKFEFDWNECFMLVTEQVGALEEEKERLAGISEKAYKANKRKEEMQAKLHNFLHSNGLKYTLILAGAFMVLYGIPAFGIFNYTEFGRIKVTKPVYNLFVNFVYRPYLGGEVEYPDWESVRKVEKKDLPKSIVANAAQPLDLKYLKNFELPSLGLTMKGPNLVPAQAVLDKQLQTLTTERFTAEGQDVRFYWVLFKTSAAAKEFAGYLINAATAVSTEGRTALNAESYVVRAANLVMIGHGKHIHHEAYVKDRFVLDEKTTSITKQ